MRDYDKAEQYSVESFGAKPTKSSGRGSQKGDFVKKVGGITLRGDTKHTESKSYQVKKHQFENMNETIVNDIEVRFLHHVFTENGKVVDEQIVLPRATFNMLLECFVKEVNKKS